METEEYPDGDQCERSEPKAAITGESSRLPVSVPFIDFRQASRLVGAPPV